MGVIQMEKIKSAVPKIEMLKIFEGKRVNIINTGSIFTDQMGVCVATFAEPSEQNEYFIFQLDNGCFYGIIPDTFGDNFVEGIISKSTGRRKIEIIR